MCSFLGSWMLHDYWGSFVTNSWEDYGSLEKNLSACQRKVTTWNKNTFGNIFYLKKHILSHIQGIQGVLEQHVSPILQKVEANLLEELERILI